MFGDICQKIAPIPLDFGFEQSVYRSADKEFFNPALGRIRWLACFLSLRIHTPQAREMHTGVCGRDGDDAVALRWNEEMTISKKTAAARVPRKQSVKSRRAVVGGSKHKSAAKHGVVAQSKAKKSTKLASMTMLLCRIKGVSLEELCKHSGWQPHSVRAVISSVMKKKLGLDVVSERIDGKRIYRVIV